MNLPKNISKDFGINKYDCKIGCNCLILILSAKNDNFIATDRIANLDIIINGIKVSYGFIYPELWEDKQCLMHQIQKKYNYLLK